MRTAVHLLIDHRTGAKLETMTAPSHVLVRRGMVIRVKVAGQVADLKVMSVHHDPISLHVRRLNWLERAGAWAIDLFGRTVWCA